MVQKLPQCRKCKNFYITYDPARPYGCRVMNFKSRRMPSLVVFETSGIICQLYDPKPEPGGDVGPSSSRTG